MKMGVGGAIVVLFAAFVSVSVATGKTCAEPPPGSFDLPAGLPNQPPGPLFIMHIGLLTVYADNLRQYETPIGIRGASVADGLTWNGVSTFSPNGTKEYFTKKFPWVSPVPSKYHTSEAQALQAEYAILGVAKMLFTPEQVEALVGYTSSIGLDTPVDIPDDIVACSMQVGGEAKRACFYDLACAAGFTPKIIGLINAQMARKFLARDGWNASGSLGKNGRECTTNCRPFSDITDYTPVNYPGSTSYPDRWQPLLEDNGKGFFFRQEHVTPHIGFTAKTRAISQERLEERNEKYLMDPMYDYAVEADLVIERMANLDDMKKMTIELMDDKLALGFAILGNLFFRHPTITFAQVSLFALGFTTSEYDSVIQSWRAKITTDLIRPTTIIQERNGGSDMITTYAGPFQGVKTFEAADFQPYVRTMPHSEFISATGCICQSISEFSDSYLKYIFNDDGPFTVVSPTPKGSSKIEPGVTPAEDINLVFPTMEALRDICGQSRLDGGMHFTASVPASFKLCKGTGKVVFRFMKYLINGVELW